MNTAFSKNMDKTLAKLNLNVATAQVRAVERAYKVSYEYLFYLVQSGSTSEVITYGLVALIKDYTELETVRVTKQPIDDQIQENLAGVCPHVGIKIGWSLCNPKDHFNRTLGKLRAIQRALPELGDSSLCTGFDEIPKYRRSAVQAAITTLFERSVLSSSGLSKITSMTLTYKEI